MKKMKLLFWEMRRYLRPQILWIVGVLTLFWGLMYGDINHNNRINRQCPYRLSVEYQQRFGNTIDRAELEEIRREYDAMMSELDALYDEAVGGYGVHSKADYDMIFAAFYDGKDSEDYAAAAEKWGEENLEEIYAACETAHQADPINLMEFQQQDIRNILWYFDLLDSGDIDLDDQSDAAVARLREYQAAGEVSLLQVILNADNYFANHFQYWTLLVYLICAVIVVPFSVNNRITNVQAMQFASKQGRAILKKQLAAALLITVLVNLAADAFFCGVAFFGPYNTRHLLGCPLNTGALKVATWLDLTYLQYVGILLCRTLLMSLALTCGLFVLTYFCGNYVGAMAVSTASIVLLYLYSHNMEVRLLTTHSPLAYPPALLIPMGAVIAVTVLLLRRIQKTNYTY